MEQSSLGYRPFWPPIDPAQVSIFHLSRRRVYTLSSASRAKPYGTSPNPFFPFLAALSLLATYQQRAPPVRHNREESILPGATDRRDLLVLPRLASRRCPSPAISFSVRFLIPALLRAVGPPTSLFQDLLASLAKVASYGVEINRSPQSCIHLNCRVMCALSEAPHRFVDCSGLRQATFGRGWSTASTTLFGTRSSVLCRVLTPYPKSFFLVLQNTKTQACAFFLMCPRSGKLLPESGTMPAKTRIAATLNWKYLQLHISDN